MDKKTQENVYGIPPASKNKQDVVERKTLGDDPLAKDMVEKGNCPFIPGVTKEFKR